MVELADTVYPAYIELFLTNANFIGTTKSPNKKNNFGQLCLQTDKVYLLYSYYIVN